MDKFTWLMPIPYYILGIITYHYWVKYVKERRRLFQGGEIVQVLKLGDK
jgi:hypothetical protein